MANPTISVCICTYNPRRESLRRSLESLAAQTLATSDWELVVIDNASNPPVTAEELEVAAHARKEIVHEPRLGLTHARVAAIREACGEILVFVDDDNVLDRAYLDQVIRIFDENSKMGVIGGPSVGEFEVEPPAWSRRYLSFLAVGDSGPQPRMTFENKGYELWFPRGAGMAVRRSAADKYREQIENDAMRAGLDRVGTELGGSGDIDLVFTALEMGMGAGYFPELRLTHLIPRERLEYDYLKRLVRDSMVSLTRLQRTRGVGKPVRPWPLEYIATVLLCVRDGGLNIKSLGLAMEIARGKYRASGT